MHNNNNNYNNNDGGGSDDNDSRFSMESFFFHLAALQPFTITLAFSVSLSFSLSLSLSHTSLKRRTKRALSLSLSVFSPYDIFLSFLSSAPRLSLFLSLPTLCPSLARHSPPAPALNSCSRVKHGREGDETTDTRTRTPLAQASTFDPAPNMRR